MEILMVIPLLFVIFVVGIGPFALFLAPITTVLAVFHDRIFAHVDVSQPTYLAVLSLTHWTALAICSWGLFLLFIVSNSLGMKFRLLNGFLSLSRP